MRLSYLVLCAALLLVYAAEKGPRYNWDLVGYVAATYSYLGLTGRSLHAATYGDIRAYADDAHFRRLTEGPDFHRAVYQDPEALQQQTHYRTRVAYVLLTLLVSGLTGSVSEATYIVSMAASAVTLLLLGSLLVEGRLAAFLLFPLVLAVDWLTSFTSIVRLSTPDMLAVMTAAAIVCAGLRRPRLAILMLPLLPSVRPDYMLLVPFFAWVLWERAYRLETAIALSLACLIYFAITGLLSTYGYLTDFNYGLIQGPQAYPEEMQLSRDTSDYVAAYQTGIQALAGYNANWLILVGAALALLTAWKGSFRKRSIQGFMLAAAAFTLLHFALFPEGHYRYYFLAISLALVTVFASASQQKPSAKA